MVVKFEVEQNC